MANVRKFRSNRCVPNSKFVEQCTPGEKLVITSAADKDNKFGKQPALGLEFKGKKGALRCNDSNIDQIAAKFGDETDEWAGKTVSITWRDTKVGDDDQVEVILTPTK